MEGNRVLLCVMSERTAKNGGAYMSGWLGKSKLLLFPGKDPDKFDNPTWDLFVVPIEPRAEGSRTPREDQAEPERRAEPAGSPES